MEAVIRTLPSVGVHSLGAIDVESNEVNYILNRKQVESSAFERVTVDSTRNTK
jgi:hypothetical protein